MGKLVLVPAILCALCGCTSLQEATAHKIGCAPHDVAISEKTTTTSGTTWIATCHGHQYECKGVWSGDEPANIECTPAS